MTAMFSFTPGTTPLVLSVPHVGTFVPPELLARMTPAAGCVPDTDWHVERLYDFAYGIGASVIAATHSRLVVDLNRDPSGQALYPGASNTELCPLGTFADEPVYRAGEAPGAAEITTRVTRYWRPYHDKLAAELARVRAMHGVAILWDAHSIVSRAPRFFAGTLPDFNLGTADGASCDGGLARQVEARLAGASGFTAIHNGRFKGGYITRHCGRPAEKVHAIQLEMAQCAYMDEGPPFAWNQQKAERVRPILKACLQLCVDWAARPQ